jgi:hypothetical protein
MGRPTELAIMNFTSAGQAADAAVNLAVSKHDTGKPEAEWHHDLELAKAIRAMALGLTQLSTGLRATYMLLEDVQRSVKQLHTRRS